jgi:prolyl-tRNA editing enzyme YbaK/EbsC (Cys-tRNA(Pro) deacylase)
MRQVADGGNLTKIIQKEARRMGASEVQAFFEERGFGDRFMPMADDCATVQLAADALGVTPGQIAKTLTFREGDGCLMIVMAGDARIDNRKFKGRFHMKARMLSADEAVELVGIAPGGICPFAIPDGIDVYLDQSLRAHEVVYPAAGDAHHVARLTLDELVELSGAEGWVDVTKPPAEPAPAPAE